MTTPNLDRRNVYMYTLTEMLKKVPSMCRDSVEFGINKKDINLLHAMMTHHMPMIYEPLLDIKDIEDKDVEGIRVHGMPVRVEPEEGTVAVYYIDEDDLSTVIKKEMR